MRDLRDDLDNQTTMLTTLADISAHSSKDINPQILAELIINIRRFISVVRLYDEMLGILPVTPIAIGMYWHCL